MAKYSLHVGVNLYSPSFYEPGGNLRGCVKDMLKMHTLVCGYGVSGSNTTVVKDQEATVSNVMFELETKVCNLLPGDKLIFTVSGHGTRVYDPSKEELDGYDEAFCCHDGLLLDDQIGYILSKAPAESTIEIYTDTCHSADQYKAISLHKECTQGLYFGFGPSDLKIKALPGFNLDKKVIAKSEIKAIVVQFAACAEDTVSYDTPNGGRFTLAVHKILEHHNYQQIPAPILYEGIKKIMGGSQVPYLRTSNLDSSLLKYYKIL